jgi:hypothetical protein
MIYIVLNKIIDETKKKPTEKGNIFKYHLDLNKCRSLLCHALARSLLKYGAVIRYPYTKNDVQ